METITEHPIIDFDGLLEGASAENMSDMDVLIDAVAYAKTLPEREQKILMLFCEGYTQEEIGARVGVSQRHIGRILSSMSKKAQNLAIDSDEHYAE